MTDLQFRIVEERDVAADRRENDARDEPSQRFRVGCGAAQSRRRNPRQRCTTTAASAETATRSGPREAQRDDRQIDRSPERTLRPTSLNRADSNTNPIQNAVPPTSARQEVKNPRSSRYLLKLWNWSGNCHQRMTTSTKPFIAGQPMLLRNFWAYFDVTDSLISPEAHWHIRQHSQRRQTNKPFCRI